jgi:predicted AAA+ superfamily ATPase
MKRLTKRRKYYFYDTGLLSYLLGLRTSADIQTQNRIGLLFENFAIAEIKKIYTNIGEYDKIMYFWNVEEDSATSEGAYEIDLLLESGRGILALEIKSSEKLNTHWFSGGAKLGKLTDVEKYVIYTGETQETSAGMALNWRDLGRVVG